VNVENSAFRHHIATGRSGIVLLLWTSPVLKQCRDKKTYTESPFFQPFYERGGMYWKRTYWQWVGNSWKLCNPTMQTNKFTFVKPNLILISAVPSSCTCFETEGSSGGRHLLFRISWCCVKAGYMKWPGDRGHSYTEQCLQGNNLTNTTPQTLGLSETTVSLFTFVSVFSSFFPTFLGIIILK